MPQSTSREMAFETALAHHQSGRLQEAERGYLDVLEQEPGHAGALHLLGMVRYQAGETDRGLKLLDRAIEIAPDYAQAHNDLGSLLRDQGRLDEAIDRYRRALEIAPDYAAAHNNLGSAFKRQGKLDEAVACYRHALELAPNYVMAHNNLGSALERQGKLEEAAACFQRAVEIEPDFVSALNNLGSALQELGDLEGAVACYERSCQIVPDSASVHLALSALLETLGRNRKARNHLEEGRNHLEESIRRRPILTDAYEGKDKPLATILKLVSLEKASVWLEDGKTMVSTGPTNETVLLGRDKFTLHKYFVFEENLLKSADELPHFDVVVNGVVNPDSERASLEAACQFIAQRDVPCVNDPRKIAATTRERVADLLADVDNLVVPRIVREELPRRDTSLFMPIVEKHGLRFPLIVRPIGGHLGTGMVKIDREEDFKKAIFFEDTLEFYFIEYHDYRSDDWYFRKLRFFFIAGKVYPYHLAISNNWLIHHHTSLMKEHEWMRKEEESFLEDYVDYLYCCNNISKILSDINDVIALDYFGLDCALLKSGEIVLFESNPAMVVRLDDPRDKFAYKYVHVPKIAKAYQDMVLAKIRQ